MNRCGAVLTEADYRRIAGLHRDLLEGSIISVLGADVLMAYYRYVDKSEHERLFVVREQDTIAGAAVLSDQPATVMSRMVMKNLPIVAVGTIRSLFTRASGWKKIADFLFRPGSRPESLDGIPEVIQIFADPAYRSRRIGSRLLAQVEEHLAGRQVGKYFVKTVDATGNTALGFYRKSGFAQVATGREGGKPYVFLHKILADHAARHGGRDA